MIVTFQQPIVMLIMKLVHADPLIAARDAQSFWRMLSTYELKRNGNCARQHRIVRRASLRRQRFSNQMHAKVTEITDHREEESLRSQLHGHIDSGFKLQFDPTSRESSLYRTVIHQSICVVEQRPAASEAGRGASSASCRCQMLLQGRLHAHQHQQGCFDHYRVQCSSFVHSAKRNLTQSPREAHPRVWPPRMPSTAALECVRYP